VPVFGSLIAGAGRFEQGMQLSLLFGAALLAVMGAATLRLRTPKTG
jgi:hypothetical protein